MTHILKHILLYTATAMLLLHGFIPHQHHGELSMAEHEREHASKDIFDFFRTVFHLSLDDKHHLENIEVGKTEISFSNLSIQTAESDIAPDYSDTFSEFNPDASMDCAWTELLRESIQRLYFYDCPLRGRLPDVGLFLSLFAFSNTGLRGPPVG